MSYVLRVGMAKKSTDATTFCYDSQVALRLLVLTAELDPPPSVLMKGRRVVLGRAAHCEVRIPDPSVSLEHAIIVKRGPNYLLIDQGSHHGTAVAINGQEPVELAPDAPRVLENGEHIWLGQIELEVRLEVAQRGAETGFSQLAPTLVRAGLEAVGVEASEGKVKEVLAELTALPDDDAPFEEEPEPDSRPGQELGVAALAEDDIHPPWVTDAFLGVLATLLAAGCLYGLVELSRTF